MTPLERYTSAAEVSAAAYVIARHATRVARQHTGSRQAVHLLKDAATRHQRTAELAHLRKVFAHNALLLHNQTRAAMTLCDIG